jgi:hypothetical protein
MVAATLRFFRLHSGHGNGNAWRASHCAPAVQ